MVDDAREITLNGLRGSPCIGVVEQRAGIDDRWRAGPRKRVAHPRIERASARRSDGGAVVDADVPAGAAAFVQ